MHISKRSTECELKLKVYDKEMSKTDQIVYLGDKVTEKGTIEETIKLRKIKSVGIISQISSILKSVTLGSFTSKQH